MGDPRLYQIGTLASLLVYGIGWLEFRKPAGDIRKGRPKLFAWYDAFIKRPSLQATLPKA